MKTLGLRHALILSALFALLLFLLSCGHRGSSSTPSGAGSPGARARTGPRTILLSNVLGDIDAYPIPKGVSADTWTMLTAELKKQLIARSKDGKTLSIEPTGTLCKVTDLAAVSDAGGTQATVTWTEALAGDCNNDGEVSIADLQPIAAHYGETSTGPGSAAYLADANGDGEVGITDLQPIAADYSMHIEGYQVWRGANDGTSTTWEATIRPNTNPANPNWSADRTASPPATSRPSYTYMDDISGLADKANVRYKVTAYGDGAAGEDSNEATMPPPGTVTHSVSGTVTEGGVGLADVTMTLMPGGLNATTQADGTYTITGVADGSYTLTPKKTSYAFAPATRSVNVSGADVTGQDFTASLPHSVSGTVLESSVGLAGVLMTLTPGGLNATTQADGTYTITGVADGSYTLTPTLAGYAFTPPTRSVNVSGADIPGQDFTVSQSGLADSAWPKFRQNQFNTGQSPYNGAQSNSLKGTFNTGGSIRSSASIGVDGTIYFGSDDCNIYAVNPDGSQKWSHPTLGTNQPAPAIGLDGTIYVGTASGTLALNPDDGTEKWSVSTGGGGSYGCAIGKDGTLYYGSGDNCLHAVNPADGSDKWATNLNGQMPGCPAIAVDGTIYVGSYDGYVYALNSLDGSVKWTHLTGASSSIPASPVVGPDGTVYAASCNGTLYALKPADGTEKWTYVTGGSFIYASPALATDGTIYVVESSAAAKMYAVNSADGSEEWRHQFDDTVTSSPAIGADGKIYIGCVDHSIYCLSPIGGDLVWKYTTGDGIYSSPTIAADGTTYIGSNDGKMYAFGAGGSTPTWSISGHVNYTVAPLDGVTVTVTPGMQTATTDLNGDYEINGVPDGDYSLDPSKPSYLFTPLSRAITVSGGNLVNQNFSAVIGPANSAWPKFHHDYFNSGQSDVVGPPGSNSPWQFLMAAQSISSPALAADGTIYVGCDTGPVYAINPDGSQKWMEGTGGNMSSTPAVGADGKVYVGCESGKLLALSPVDGSVIWVFPTGGAISYFGGPAVGPDGTVYVGCCDKNIYAIDPVTGTQKWQHATGDVVRGCPAIGVDGTIYIGSADGNVYALNPLDGSVKWTHAAGGAVYASPSVGWDGTIFVGVWDAKKMLALNPSDGSEKWSYPTTGNVDSCPAWSSDGIVYFGDTSGVVYALYGIDGTLKWQFNPSLSPIESSPAIGADGTVYIGSYDNGVYAINPDGTQKWRYTTLAQVLSSPALAAGRLYIAGEDWSLHCIGS